MNEDEKESRLTSLAIRGIVFPQFGTSEEYDSYPKEKIQYKIIVLKEVLISISKEKNIVSTTIPAREGTIKEYIGADDYNITVDVGISDTDLEKEKYSTDYPLDKVEEFIKIINQPLELEVQSDFLELFNIKSAIVTGYNLQQETHSNRQSLSIKMISETPYLIRLKKEENKP